MSYSYRLPDPQWSGSLRRCCVCRALDNPVYAGESDEQGAPIFAHKVTLDVTYINRDKLTPKEIKQGFEYMKVEGDRHVKIRAICRECLQLIEDTADVWHDFDTAKKNAGDQNKPQSFYETLCME
jgi:hypothetical protein